MALTLKNMLDAVMLEAGMDTEAEYATSDVDAVKRLMYLANRAVDTLAMWPWQALRKTYTFTLTSATSYALPEDFQALLPDTTYDDSTMFGVDIPADDSEWAYLQSQSAGSDYRVKARILGGTLRVYQPNAGDTVRLEYLSSFAVQDSGGTAKQRFTADTDTTKLDDELVIRDTLWRYKKLMGLEFETDLMETKAYEKTLHGMSGGSKTIIPCQRDSTGPYYDLWRSVPNSDA